MLSSGPCLSYSNFLSSQWFVSRVYYCSIISSFGISCWPGYCMAWNPESDHSAYWNCSIVCDSPNCWTSIVFLFLENENIFFQPIGQEKDCVFITFLLLHFYCGWFSIYLFLGLFARYSNGASLLRRRTGGKPSCSYISQDQGKKRTITQSQLLRFARNFAFAKVWSEELPYDLLRHNSASFPTRPFCQLLHF